jgi:hypothetical protein
MLLLPASSIISKEMAVNAQGIGLPSEGAAGKRETPAPEAYHPIDHEE